MRLFIKKKLVSIHQCDFDFFKSAQQFEDEINLLKEYEGFTGPESVIFNSVGSDCLLLNNMKNQLQDLCDSCQNPRMANDSYDNTLEFGLPPNYFFNNPDH